MANPSQVRILREEGVEAWNAHLERAEIPMVFHDGKFLRNPSKTQIDFSQANLSGLDLTGIDLYRANLAQANLRRANLEGAVLRDAYLQGVDLSDCRAVRADLYCADLSLAQLQGACFADAHLWEANLWQAKCSRTDFTRANLTSADLKDAYLFRANLNHARLVAATLENADLTLARLRHADLSKATLDRAEIHQTDLENADLSYTSFIKTLLVDSRISGSRVYGISVWDVDPENLQQNNLIVTPNDQPTITVDDLEVAQFIYLLLNRKKFRNVIDTITSKAVLILGRFTPERKEVLDAMASELRKHNLLPVIFDFERSTERDFTETIKTLVGLSLFVIADITNPKSSPLELQASVPDYQVPFVPIIQEGEEPFSMFRDLRGKYDWVLKPLKYSNIDNLLLGFKRAIIDRAWEKHHELQRKKVVEIEALSIDEYLAEAGSQSD